MADILTKEDAFKFLNTILKISDPQAELSKLSKLDLLKLLVDRWYEHVPFQNIDQLILTDNEKRLPTVKEIIKFQMAGRGGVCLYQAAFFYFLLNALDYRAHMSAASVYRPDDHAVVVVSDVQDPGDRYLIETGCGWPAFQPIPINNIGTDVTKSPQYKQSNLEYTYVQEGEYVMRYHRKGDHIKSHSEPVSGGWRWHSKLDLKPVSLDYLFSTETSIHVTCTDLSVPGLTRFLVAIHFPNKYSFVIKDMTIIQDEEGKRTITPVEDMKEVLGIYKEHFPTLDEESIVKAYGIVEKHVKQYGAPSITATSTPADGELGQIQFSLIG